MSVLECATLINSQASFLHERLLVWSGLWGQCCRQQRSARASCFAEPSSGTKSPHADTLKMDRWDIFAITEAIYTKGTHAHKRSEPRTVA